jgi:hypothetical protein
VAGGGALCLALLVVVLVLSVWLIRRCWRFLKQLFTRVARIFSGKPDRLLPAFTKPPFQGRWTLTLTCCARDADDATLEI